jgi:hypothetical protein
MKMEQTECSETLAYAIQMPDNYPEESTQHPELSESLKSRIIQLFLIEVLERMNKANSLNRRTILI